MSSTSVSEETVNSFEIVEPDSKTKLYSEDSLLSLQNSNRDEILRKTKYNILLKPFDLKQIFGFNVRNKVLNFTKSTHIEIFYTAAHIGVLYRHSTKEMIFYRGHKSIIVSMGVDKNKKYMVSTDYGADNSILVWDLHKNKIIFSIFQPYPNGSLIVHISSNAKYLITVGLVEEKWQIDFWLWTLGETRPDSTVFISNIHGLPKVINAHSNADHIFMIVFEKTTIFFTWDLEKQQLREPHIPTVRNRKLYGHFTDGAYVLFSHECLVSSSKGYILVYSRFLYPKNFKLSNVRNDGRIFLKGVKICDCAITCMKSADGVVLTGDVNGQILCLDKKLRLLYTFPKYGTSAIVFISFSLDKQYRMYEKLESENNQQNTRLDEDDTGLYRSKSAPTDFTLEQNPFTMRQLIISTVDGRVYSFDAVLRKYIEIFNFADSPIVAIDLHHEFPYLLTACKSGKISLFNHETSEEVVTTYLPIEASRTVISCIKYSSNSLHLACGLTNGQVWILEPILLKPKINEPFKHCHGKIEKIIFSPDSLQMAYYDSNMTVIIYFYDVNDNWMFKGKIRSHYEPIVNILFSPCKPYYLITLGCDRYLVKYNNFCTMKDNELEILTRERVEQKDVPTYFITYFKEKSNTYDYIMIDNRFKFKRLNSETNMCMSVCLGPAFGCFYNSPLRKIEMIPNTDNQFMIYMNKNFIGLQMMPIDGNPYKYVSSIAHPIEIFDFALSYDGQYVFTVGVNDLCVFKRKINLRSVLTMHQLGGFELEPFYCLIEGGKNGWFFQEMQDLFYYMQILHQGENNPLPRVVSDSISIDDLPDMMRACGYYPSDYEIENMLVDIKYRDFDETKTLKTDITFCEFVQLFINHKPVYGYMIDELKSNFQKFTNYSETVFHKPNQISFTDFIELFTTTGERFTKSNLFRCLNILLRLEDSHTQATIARLIPDISFKIFTKDILGIELDKESEIDDDEDKVSSVSDAHSKADDDKYIVNDDDIAAAIRRIVIPQINPTLSDADRDESLQNSN